MATRLFWKRTFLQQERWLRGFSAPAATIAHEARSGDGTVENVGLKVSGHMHRRMPGDKVYRVIVLNEAGGEVLGASLGGDEVFRIKLCCAQVGPVIEQVADALKTHAHFIVLLEGGTELQDVDCISDFSAVIVKQDMCRSADTALDD